MSIPGAAWETFSAGGVSLRSRSRYPSRRSTTLRVSGSAGSYSLGLGSVGYVGQFHPPQSSIPLPGRDRGRPPTYTSPRSPGAIPPAASYGRGEGAQTAVTVALPRRRRQSFLGVVPRDVFGGICSSIVRSSGSGNARASPSLRTHSRNRVPPDACGCRECRECGDRRRPRAVHRHQAGGPSSVHCHCQPRRRSVTTTRRLPICTRICVVAGELWVHTPSTRAPTAHFASRGIDLESNPGAAAAPPAPAAAIAIPGINANGQRKVSPRSGVGLGCGAIPPNDIISRMRTASNVARSDQTKKISRSTSQRFRRSRTGVG